jgi:hypothetical protein
VPESEGLHDFPEGKAFKDFLLKAQQADKLVPASYPVNQKAYDEWKNAVHVNGGELKGQVRHVSFEEFLSSFISQTRAAERQLIEKGILHDKSVCYLNLYRSNSGVSQDDLHKSSGWMKELFGKLVEFGGVKELGACWKRTNLSALGRGTPETNVVRDTCVYLVDPDVEGWVAKRKELYDIALVIEDVAYSGTEFVSTFQQMQCSITGPRATVFITPFFRENPGLQAYVTKEYESDTAKFKKILLSLFPWDLNEGGKGTFQCKGGIVTSMETDKDCFIYFDHKIADGTSVASVEQVSLQGGVLSPEKYEALRKEDWEDVGDKPFAQVIPFITGCEESNRCAASYRGTRNACEDMHCPIAPYKDQRKFSACNCGR